MKEMLADLSVEKISEFLKKFDMRLYILEEQNTIKKTYTVVNKNNELIYNGDKKGFLQWLFYINFLKESGRLN